MRIKSIVPAMAFVFAVAVIIVAFGTQPILAQGREFVGVTAVPTAPSVGILALHDLCAADFEDARMCSSIDIVRNGVRDGVPFPARLAGRAR